MGPQDLKYQEVRSRICDAFLVWSAILAIPALATSLYRVRDVGWQPVLISHLFLASAYWAVVLYRKRLPYHVCAGTIVLMFIIVGCAGAWSFGLMTFGGAGFVVAPILAAIFFGARFGFVVWAIVAVIVAPIGTITVLNHRLPPFDMETYVTSMEAWMSAGVFWSLAGGSVVFIIGSLNKYFIEALETSERHAGALEETQREYLNIFDNMVDTFYRADKDGRMVLISPSVVDIGGYVPEDLIGKELSRFYVEDGKREEFLELLEDGGGRVHEFTAEIQTKNGGTIWASTSARHWKDAEGNILGVEGTIRNITAQKTAEEALIRSRKMEAVGQMSGGIAHDYNNMLGVIIGNIQMVEEAADLDDKSRQRLDKALAAAQRNADLTAKLLGFSRVQPRGTQLTAVNDFIASLEDIITTSLTASIKVRTDLSQGLWLVDIDPAELEDMILNLAINARDAIPGGGVLSIETTNKVLDNDHVKKIPGGHAGDYVMICVSDTGAGMTKEIRDKIFDPFFSTKEPGKGTGLGLSMVYAFVQRSGGFITVYSEPGEGATFNIFLPRAQDSEESATDPNQDDDQELSHGTETVLVVDDEEFLVDLAVTCLEDLGYRTLSASSGDQAFEVLKANPGINLLFSDIVMPGKLDGRALALAARHLYPSLKVLLTSGFAGEHETYVSGGDEDIARMTVNRLRKPYTLTELATAVRQRLDE